MLLPCADVPLVGEEGTPEGFERAARLYRGDLLAGLVVQAPPFEEWLVAERERLRERAVEALARLCSYQRGTGAPEAAVDTALRLLALDPLQESMAACQQGLPGGQDATIPLLPPLLGDRYWLAVSYAMRGEFAEGLVTAKAMLDAAERLDRPLARIWAAYALARVYLSKGDAEDAAAILEPLLAQARDVEFWTFYTRIAGHSAAPNRLYYNASRPHQALDQNSPHPRHSEPPCLSQIVAILHLGGLHHRYQRAA